MEFRAFVEVRSPIERPPADWHHLFETLERRAGAYGPVMSFWPDRPGDSAEVTVSTQAADAVDAGRLLTDAVYLALLAAGLLDCYVARVELETAEAPAQAVA